MRFPSLRLDRAVAASPPRTVTEAPRLALGERFEIERALQTAYAACWAIELVLLPLGGRVQWREVGPALALQVLIGVLMAFRAPLRLNRLRLLGVVGVAGYLVSVVLLRDGTAPSAGYGILALMPVVWVSLRGGRREFWVSIAGLAAVYLLPMVVVGPPQYPAGGWRSGLLMLVLATVLGISVRQLVSRVQALMGQLDELARTDDLTGLPNRRGWRELLDRELATARRTGRPLTVALFDIDHFKEYNDAHGHLAGDRLLLRASAVWQSSLRETDVLARWGGDEFGVLLPACDTDQARSLIDRMRAAQPDVVFSVGLETWDGHSPADEVVARADDALYAVKQARGVASLPPGAV
jgi:diguanylate cyclase (GGDEF)-like protein